VTAISEFTEMATWPGTTPTSPLIITLQKANSIAVCNVATANWTDLFNSVLSDATIYARCPACSGWIDMRDLGQVLEHEGPLPHPSQDQPQ
jgi:hypothetical protein